VYDLIRENGSVRGVRYQTSETEDDVRALLTVGADGRHSRVRHLAGFEPKLRGLWTCFGSSCPSSARI